MRPSQSDSAASARKVLSSAARVCYLPVDPSRAFACDSPSEDAVVLSLSPFRGPLRLPFLGALGASALLLAACASPDYRPKAWEPGAARVLAEGERFETVARRAEGSDSGISLFVGLIHLSRPSYCGAHDDLMQRLGLDPTDPDLTLHNLNTGSSFTSLFLVDWETVTMIADVLRVVRDDPPAADPHSSEPPAAENP
ncbi:MAG: hypothetical protein AB1486_01290 [Planctomycetota bacterium]